MSSGRIGLAIVVSAAVCIRPTTAILPAPLGSRLAQAVQHQIGVVRNGGGYVAEGLEVAAITGKGLGVVAARRLAKGEPLLTIPGDLDLSSLAAACCEDAKLDWDLSHATSMSASEAREEDVLAARIALSVGVAEKGCADSGGCTPTRFAELWATLDLDQRVGHMVSPMGDAEGWGLLRGSAEFFRPAEYARLSKLAATLSDSLGDARSVFNETKFLLSRLFVKANQFAGRKDGRGFLPMVGVYLNHNVKARANAEYYWDDEANEFNVWSSRDVEVGEEVSICYGLRSNAELLQLHGFTVDPSAEPRFTFTMPSGGGKQFGAARLQLTTLEYTASQSDPSSIVATPAPPGTPEAKLAQSSPRSSDEPQNSMSAAAAAGRSSGALEMLHQPLHFMGATIQLLEMAAAEGLSAEDALTALVQTSYAKFQDDVVIQPHIERVSANRARNPQSWVWWAPGDDRDQVDESSAEALGSRWKSDVVRSKMSEYLCLTVYLEALAIRRGDLARDQALPHASQVQMLLEALLRFSRRSNAEL